MKWDQMKQMLTTAVWGLTLTSFGSCSCFQVNSCVNKQPEDILCFVLFLELLHVEEVEREKPGAE